MAKIYKLFISHRWEYDNMLRNLKNLLNERGYFSAEYYQFEKNCPCNSEEASVIKANITKRLKETDVVLAIAGVSASYSEWMQWEMDKALELGLKIVGVIPRGNKYVSKEVSQRSVENVRWNTESVVEAIRKYSK